MQLDVSQLLAKPVIVIQSSDNVTKLLGALLRYGLGQWERLGESRSSVSGPLPSCHSQGLPWGGFSHSASCLLGWCRACAGVEASWG